MFFKIQKGKDFLPHPAKQVVLLALTDAVIGRVMHSTWVIPPLLSMCCQQEKKLNLSFTALHWIEAQVSLN